ncbi:hypothetical protein Vi05172_g11543 [Venturia inaequalis]|nr:hypothetical protein Vi05172_g11543 [Venturia inaequalis]
MLMLVLVGGGRWVQVLDQGQVVSYMWQTTTFVRPTIDEHEVALIALATKESKSGASAQMLKNNI